MKGWFDLGKHAVRIAAFGAFASAFLPGMHAQAEVTTPEVKRTLPAYPEDPSVEADTFRMQIPIKPGLSFGLIMQEWGLPTNQILRAAAPLYDLATIRPDRALSLEFGDGEAKAVAVRYQMDPDNTVVVRRQGDVWEATMESVAYESSLAGSRLVIENSLWQAGMDAGFRAEDLVTLSQIFEYELDFNTELRKGATFEVVAEVLSAEGRRDRLGDVHAVRLSNGGKVLEAVRYVVEEKESWYHPDGTGMQRPFLRSPLEFSARVTSSFNPNRFHPVLKRRRPHNGTDFGAPTGTPVRSVASGVVEYAGVSGGHGNFVKIRHDGGIQTSYSHLSRIHVKRGQRVNQGQRIGRVGSTGMSTGPHLHYQMWKNGKFVDAMKVVLPASPPLEKAELGAFREEVQKWLPLLGSEGQLNEPAVASPE